MFFWCQYCWLFNFAQFLFRATIKVNSSGVFLLYTCHWSNNLHNLEMVVICHLERDKDKVLKFRLNNTCCFQMDTFFFLMLSSNKHRTALFEVK